MRTSVGRVVVASRVACARARDGARRGDGGARARTGQRVGARRVGARASEREPIEGEILEGDFVDSAASEDGGVASRLSRLDGLGSKSGAVYASAEDEGTDAAEDAVGSSVDVSVVSTMDVSALRSRDSRADVETVQLIACKFQLRKQITFGEELRLVGSHAKLGAWDMSKSLTLTWGEGDVWTTEDIELPVDGVFIYKYAVVPAGQPEQVKQWQQGNNQVLTLSSADHPRLWVTDAWNGDPGASNIYREGGLSDSKETRLINRVKEADSRVKVAEMQVKNLQGDLKMANAQVNALREEARLAANVRIALKEQLKAEQRRSNVLSSQIDAWKEKFMQITDGSDGSDDVIDSSSKKKRTTR